MAKSYEISQSQLLEIEATRKKNRNKNGNKNIERRLYVLVMRAEGKTLEEIAEKTGYHASTVSKLISKYMHNGISAIAENHYQGNRRNMSFEEEAAILAPFIERAERGEMVDTINEQILKNAQNHPIPVKRHFEQKSLARHNF